MSRTKRATIGALFGYSRFALAIVVGLSLVPFTLRHIGAEFYGYWLASGELLAYAALTEFGVLVTLPWLVAEADGQGDRNRMRELLTTGGAAALLSAGAALLISLALWFVLPSVLHLPPEKQAAVLGPLVVMGIIGVVAFPLRVFSCVLTGLQDVRFIGIVDLAVNVLNPALTVILLLRGDGSVRPGPRDRGAAAARRVREHGAPPVHCARPVSRLAPAAMARHQSPVRRGHGCVGRGMGLAADQRERRARARDAGATHGDRGARRHQQARAGPDATVVGPLRQRPRRPGASRRGAAGPAPSGVDCRHGARVSGARRIGRLRHPGGESRVRQGDGSG